jgi:diphthamide synthase (EF-2-diphthine--ammonia ligase)
MNNTYLSPNEEVVLMFGGHDSSINVKNMLQEGGEVHPIEATHVPIDDSYVSYLHMTHL